MVAKPAELTPLTALAFAKLGEEAGVPPGVFNIVTGKSSVIGKVLTGSPLVRKFSFTGSTPVGVLLAEQCAPTMKRISMELGGNAPLLIFDDADLDTAIETAMVAKFRNGGQSCVAANRIYVQAGIRDKFLSGFAAKVNAMSAGDGFDDANDIGPLIDSRAVDKVDEHREDAIARGGQCLAGGASPGGRIAVPTLVADVPSDAKLATEETFGPLAGVITFDTVEKGLALANDTPFGLAAYLCSSDPATINHVAPPSADRHGRDQHGIDLDCPCALRRGQDVRRGQGRLAIRHRGISQPQIYLPRRTIGTKPCAIPAKPSSPVRRQARSTRLRCRRICQ